MKAYFDKSIFVNPFYEYLKWLLMKVRYQTQNWGKHLRIGYLSQLHDCKFGQYNYVGRGVTLVHCKIGDFTYVANNCTITHASIGKFCSIGPDVKIAPGRHPTSGFVSTHPAIFSRPNFLQRSFAPGEMYTGNIQVDIGNDVWIGANCILLDGVRIGDGAIIAAYSVVNRNVEAYSIVGGSPAKFIKKRFEDEEIEKLLKVKWWDKSADWIQENIKLLWDIKNFHDHDFEK